MNGIINIYKPKGITSHDAVHKVRKLCNTKRVGHAGTLDPMACGVLPVLIGSACAGQDYIMEHDKVYIAGIRFGTLTDTGDVTGTVLNTSEDIPSEEEIKSLGEGFVGEILQLPPMYSAIKINGKKLYELAREGKSVEREKRKITVYSSKMLSKVNETDYYFEFSVSKGTYIRTLAEDIGNALGCGATLFSLERTLCGEFTKENSITLEHLALISEEKGESGIEEILMPAEACFMDLPIIHLSEFFTKLCKNGLEIYLDKIKVNEEIFGQKGLCRLYDFDGNFFAVGQLSEFSSGKAVKAKIRFDTVRK